MHSPRWPFLVIAALAAAAVFFLMRQQQSAETMRHALARQNEILRERARLQAENQQLAAQRLSPEDLASLRDERAAVAALQTDLEALRRRAKAAAPTPVARTAPTTPDAVKEPSLTETSLAAHQWRKAGAATPEAGFETALWAAAGGDLETLSGVLSVHPALRAQIDEYMNGLPPVLRAELGTPDGLVALMTAKAVPLGSARIMNLLPITDSESRLVAQLSEPDGRSKTAMFILRREDDRWRLVVPANVLAKYRAELQAPKIPAAGNP